MKLITLQAREVDQKKKKQPKTNAQHQDSHGRTGKNNSVSADTDQEVITVAENPICPDDGGLRRHKRYAELGKSIKSYKKQSNSLWLGKWDYNVVNGIAIYDYSWPKQYTQVRVQYKYTTHMMDLPVSLSMQWDAIRSHIHRV